MLMNNRPAVKISCQNCKIKKKEKRNFSLRVDLLFVKMKLKLCRNNALKYMFFSLQKLSKFANKLNDFYCCCSLFSGNALIIY